MPATCARVQNVTLSIFTCVRVRATCLHAACRLARQLNKISNFKHKSWYVHMVVFIVPQQIMEHGDMWRSSTAAIESRGARLKRIGRATVSWRGAVNGWCAQKQSKGVKVQKLMGRSYSSSAVQQLLMKAAMTEEIWHGSADYCTPEHLRLQRHLRSRKLKIEMTDDLSDHMSAFQVLSDKAKKAGCSEADAQLPLRKSKPSLDAADRVHTSIQGLPVFGPVPRLS
eukprot:1217039-Pleurochrysis_carterae.AAC.1